MRMSHRAGIVRRRSAAGPLGAAVVVMVSAFAGCSGGEPVTPEAIAAARKAWNDAGIRDYDLEWTSSGTNQAHYFVTVRGGVVRKLESVAPDGRKFELHPGEPRFYGVDGLFLTMADELAQLKTDRPFGQPKGTRVAMRFTPRPEARLSPVLPPRRPGHLPIGGHRCHSSDPPGRGDRLNPRKPRRRAAAVSPGIPRPKTSKAGYSITITAVYHCAMH